MLRIFRRVRLAALARLRQLARAHERPRHARAVLRRHREARTDHRARPAHPVSHRPVRPRHHRRFRPRRAVVADPGGARAVFPAARNRADDLRAHRPALARRRERRPISAAADSAPGAVHRADGGGFRRSVDPAHDARPRRGADRRGHRRPPDHRGAHARGWAGAAPAGRWPDVAHLDRHSPAAAQSAARRPRHAASSCSSCR